MDFLEDIRSPESSNLVPDSRFVSNMNAVCIFFAVKLRNSNPSDKSQFSSASTQGF